LLLYRTFAENGLLTAGDDLAEQRHQYLLGGLMAIILTMFEYLFGCHHVHISRVFTVGGETYKVCCDCGAKFAYSMETMSIERRLPPAHVITRFRVA
jgi:hypothetical protein